MEINTKWFSFKDFDAHYNILLFGLRIRIKHKLFFNYKPAVEYGVTTEKRDTRLIVSLTSFPARIKTVHQTINTLLRQTVKPDHIILWLSED